MSLVQLRAERHGVAELSRPLAALDCLGQSQLQLANSDYKASTLGYEYEYFVGKPVVQFQTDSSGCATVTQGGQKHRDMLAQSHLALQLFQLHLTDTLGYDLAPFLQAGSTLLSNLHRVTVGGRHGLVGLSSIHKKEYPGHRVPWLSALLQGAVIRVMCRMWQVENREEYLAAALSATEPFHVPVVRGGVLTELWGSGDWYEEYPFIGQCRHVLNGFVSSLFSLHELFRVTADRRVLELWSRGVDALKSPGLLDQFDTGYWTRYDLDPGVVGLTPASIRYHNVHALQMLVLSRITGEKCFRDAAERWSSYSRRTGTRMVSHMLGVVYRLSQAGRYARELAGAMAG